MRSAGAAIKAEIWALDPAGFGAFVGGIPAPLGIGTVRLSDGGSVKGFLVEAETVKTAEASRVSAVGALISNLTDRVWGQIRRRRAQAAPA
ncbi:MAG: allophanate hydrolase-related protein [Roseiarcus sp.]